MQENQNRILQKRFKRLIQEAQALLNMSPQEFENKYSELFQHLDDRTLEIRHNEDELTINCFTNEQNQCTDIHFFFDRIEDEDTFINHLVDHVDYSFRKRV